MMKTILVTLFCCILFLQGNSQNEEYKHVGSASVGLSLTGAFINLLEKASPTGEFVVKNTPSLQLTYDYGIKKFFSVGIAVGYQKFNIDADDFTWTDDDGISQIETFSADYSRLNVAIRPLFHYANNEDLDLYSGFRIGLVNNRFSSDSENENLEIDGFENLNRPAVAITAFGLRYYFTDNIGAGFEINLGAPYITALNINARF